MLSLRSIQAAALVALLLPAPADAADARDPVARARALYNQRQWDAAIAAAEQAHAVPGRGDSADLVAARAYLERFRESASADDLTSARARLARLDPQRFPSRERAEFVVGLGEALFFDEAYGAAAALFEAALGGRDVDLGGDARERALDWWATSLDRDARPRPDLDRQGIYQRIRERVSVELAAHPSSGAAAYWSAAAPWAQGDQQTAWDAAQAAWVRAPLAADRGAALRADLDRLVLRGIVPDRAKALAVAPDTLRADWERFKEKWKR